MTNTLLCILIFNQLFLTLFFIIDIFILHRKNIELEYKYISFELDRLEEKIKNQFES